MGRTTGGCSEKVSSERDESLIMRGATDRRSARPGGLGYRISTLAFLTTTLLTACGGGGGGGGGDQFVGAALVNIDAVPRETDPGKRVQVTVRINEVHPDGVFVKIRFPDGFSYAPGTGRFSVQETKRSIDPQFNLAGTKEGVVYLVFNLARSLFGEDNEGMLVLELNADSGVQSGKIEIDADVNDPTVADPAEFSVENPEFDGQDDVEIKVRG